MIRTDFQYKMTQLCRKKIWEVHVYIYPKLWIFSVSIFPKLFGCGIQSSILSVIKMEAIWVYMLKNQHI